jgi:hypothetical protein
MMLGDPFGGKQSASSRKGCATRGAGPGTRQVPPGGPSAAGPWRTRRGRRGLRRGVGHGPVRRRAARGAGAGRRGGPAHPAAGWRWSACAGPPLAGWPPLTFAPEHPEATGSNFSTGSGIPLAFRVTSRWDPRAAASSRTVWPVEGHETALGTRYGLGQGPEDGDLLGAGRGQVLLQGRLALLVKGRPGAAPITSAVEAAVSAARVDPADRRLR